MTQQELSLPLNDIADLREYAERVMHVETFDVQKWPPVPVLRLRGRLLTDPDQAYEQVAPLFKSLNYTAFLEEDELGACLIAMPGLIKPAESRLWLALLLFGLTLLSTIFVGYLIAEENLLTGIAYAASLLGILGAHELGHYFASRRLGVKASFPFFIPFPLGPIGTMGAVIQMKEPPKNRAQMLTIAIAGPLAGLVVAIPVLWIGLSLSSLAPFPPSDVDAFMLEGNSIIYSLMKFAVFGRFLPGDGVDVWIHPVAWAGWAGLLVTSLNLIPAGQLDGGHILYALVGRKIAGYVSLVIPFILAAMGFLWEGWWVWAVLTFFIGQTRAPLLNELSPLNPKQRMIAIAGLVIFVLVFIPVPLTIVEL